MEMEGSGERDELVWQRKREKEEFDYRHIFHPLSLSPSIHLTHSLSARGAEQTYLGKTNMRDYMSQKHSHKHKSKQTNQKELS